MLHMRFHIHTPISRHIKTNTNFRSYSFKTSFIQDWNVAGGLWAGWRRLRPNHCFNEKMDLSGHPTHSILWESYSITQRVIPHHRIYKRSAYETTAPATEDEKPPHKPTLFPPIRRHRRELKMYSIHQTSRGTTDGNARDPVLFPNSLCGLCEYNW